MMPRLAGVAQLGLVISKQNVPAEQRQLREGTPNLLHLQLAEGDGLDCRHRYLGNPNAIRVAVQQEDVN